MTTTARTEPPRTWAGCESCYSRGRLVGVWVDPTDLTAEQIHAQSSIDPARAGCEEFVCMDTDGLPIDGESALEEAAAWGELYDEVGDHMWPRRAHT